jgi:outer membrane protein OmpU
MKNIAKILFVAISSFSLMFSANAGELTVSGTAKATYNATSGQQVDNGLGISNELSFTASGEMDNGYAWSYSMALDPTESGTSSSTAYPASGSALNDDTSITVTMNDLGTAKICVSTCGNNKKYAYSADAYGKMSDTGLSEGINFPADEGSYATIQYHTPELPFGTTGSIAHGNTKSDGQSSNAQADSGDSATFYSLVTKPIDGLTLSGSYYTVNNYADGTAHDQEEEGGAYGVKYSAGNLTIGYGKSFLAEEISAIDSAAVEYYENTGISVGYAVNDDLTLSYTDETGERNYLTSTTTVYDIEVQSIQAAYSLGGATLSLARTDYENIGFADGVDATETIIALSFAF